jgi:hypothetical protein
MKGVEMRIPKCLKSLPYFGGACALIALAGCSNNQGNPAPTGPPPHQTLQQKIQAIQNNPELPAPAKQAAIQKLEQQAGTNTNTNGQ